MEVSAVLVKQVVHRYFQSLNSEEHPVEEFVSPAVKLFDNTNQVNYDRQGMQGGAHGIYMVDDIGQSHL